MLIRLNSLGGVVLLFVDFTNGFVEFGGHGELVVIKKLRDGVPKVLDRLGGILVLVCLGGLGVVVCGVVTVSRLLVRTKRKDDMVSEQENSNKILYSKQRRNASYERKGQIM